MKKILSILTFALAIMMVSCTKEGDNTINVINDHNVAPANVVALTTLAESKSTWSTDRRYFDLSFSGEGVSVVTTLVGFDALLTPGQYLLGADEIGKAIAAKTKLNNEAVETGWITVTKKGDDYVFSFSLGGKVFSWTGALPFEADPAPAQLKDVVFAKAYKANKYLTVQLATTGLSKEAENWVGDGKCLAVDLYSEDGYLHDGNYVASAVGGTILPGEFGIGYDENLGSCLWTVAGGAGTAEKIVAGLVTVSSRVETKEEEEVTIWTISWGVKYPVEVLFEGEIPALTKPKVAPEFYYTYELGEPSDCVLSDYTLVSGVKKNPVTIKDLDGTIVAYLEFVLAEDDKEFEGSFVSTEYAHEVGQLANGYYLDYSAWGYGIIKGGSYYLDADGKEVYIEPEKVVTVTKLVTGAYQFVGEGFDIKASGPDYVPGSYKDPDAAEQDEDGSDLSGVVLIVNSGLTYAMDDQTASNTDADKNPLSGVTLWKIYVLDGENLVAGFDLVVDAGSEDITGTYEVMSYPNEAGKAGNGWGFLPYMVGGCYYAVGENYYFIPIGATITVSSNSDGTLKFKFSGDIQNSDYSEGGQGGLLLNHVAKQ